MGCGAALAGTEVSTKEEEEEEKEEDPQRLKAEWQVLHAQRMESKEREFMLRAGKLNDVLRPQLRLVFLVVPLLLAAHRVAAVRARAGSARRSWSARRS
eukprot:7946455-Pyramimonas_sp.AAC.1